MVVLPVVVRAVAGSNPVLPPKMYNEIKLSTINELFYLDDSLLLRNKINRHLKNKDMHVIGSLHKGYRVTSIRCKNFYVHRIIYQIYNNCELSGDVQIDHVDCDKENNHPKNLRIATASDNKTNTKIQANNTSGFKGVHFNTKMQKWISRLKRHGKVYYLGAFDDPTEAYLVYCTKNLELNGEFFNFG